MVQFEKIFLFVVFIFSVKVLCSDRKFALMVDEKIENCAPAKTDAKAFDYKRLELIALGDYNVYLNGTIKIRKDVKSPVPFHVYAERFDRNQWHMSIVNSRRSDFCTAIHDPDEIWYNKTKRFEECPIKAGVSLSEKMFDEKSSDSFSLKTKWHFDMEPAFDFPLYLTPSFEGKWRLSIIQHFGNTLNCVRFFGDIYEV